LTITEVPVTVPMPLIESDVAPVSDHESVALCPAVIDVGDAVKEEMVGGLMATVTVSVAAQVAVPPAPWKVPVYVVVCPGETDCEPESATDPMDEIVPVVAFCDDQESVEVCPAVMELGEAEMEHVGRGEITGVTVTVVCAVTEPCALVAGSVYVVVCVGETVIELPVTVPTPLSIEIVVALLVDHERAELCPAVMVLGEAVKEEMVGANGLVPETVTVVVTAGT
jgi:hypothetical protein